MRSIYLAAAIVCFVGWSVSGEWYQLAVSGLFFILAGTTGDDGRE